MDAPPKTAMTPDRHHPSLAKKWIRAVTDSYRNVVVRIYSRVRFAILHQVFLIEIGQYLPREGRILELGCGFGLFSLFFAGVEPRRFIVGVDLNERRIGYARESAARLGVERVRYEHADVLTWESSEKFDAIYMLDLIHHLPADEVHEFLRRTRTRLADGGLLVLKDLADTPWYKKVFALVLDRLMVGWEPIHYWNPRALRAELESLGFEVVRHRLNDFLPYPHIIYVARLPAVKRADGEPAL